MKHNLERINQLSQFLDKGGHFRKCKKKEMPKVKKKKPNAFE
jgi:hypothetical protein